MRTQLEAGIRPTDIAKANHVSTSFVTQIKKDLQASGVDKVPVVRGRRRLIHHAAEQGLAEFLEDNPTALREECCDFLEDEYDIDADVATIRRALARLNVTNKRATKINANQDPDLITHFLARMAHYSADQIVAVDESTANERTQDRKYGWAPRGMPY